VLHSHADLEALGARERHHASMNHFGDLGRVSVILNRVQDFTA
jgi:hypothetical protein